MNLLKNMEVEKLIACLLSLGCRLTDRTRNTPLREEIFYETFPQSDLLR